MRPHALTRLLIVAAALLVGMGQSVSALAHGSAHAHEAEHRASEPVHHDQDHDQDRDQDHDTGHDFGPAQALAVAPDAHHHEHPHAMVDAGLKSRADALPLVASSAAPLLPVVSVTSESVASRAFSFAPPSHRHRSPSSPRAPPAR